MPEWDTITCIAIGDGGGVELESAISTLTRLDVSVRG